MGHWGIQLKPTCTMHNVPLSLVQRWGNKRHGIVVDSIYKDHSSSCINICGMNTIANDIILGKTTLMKFLYKVLVFYVNVQFL